jgi:ketosteroid isomerase-like protein
MKKEEKRHLIELYLGYYNAFNIDGLMSIIHHDIEFKNVSGGEVTATASGTDEFRKLAEQSKELFSSRKQTITKFRTEDDLVFMDVEYEGVLASDLPNGMNAGETLRLNGRSEFTFRDGKIYRLTDTS